jgi:hypothetical protein
MNPSSRSLILLSALVVSGSAIAAETASVDHTVATNLPDVRAFVNAPADFNPLTATAEELASFGFPPRPDSATAPKAYAEWVRAVTAPATAIVPQLEETSIYHGPAQIVGTLGTQSETSNSIAVDSSNWSGYAVVNANNPFKVEAVQANYIVPVAQQAFGTCSSSYRYGSAWVGIDGYNSDDVLQDGIEFDASCSHGSTSPFYAAWYEWYPNAETRINNFKLSPGDDMFVEVWNTSSTAGNAYIVNYTANTKVQISFNAPKGTKLQGNSVEWIVERPGVNGGLATLTNYVATAFTQNVAWNYTSKKPTNNYPGGAPSGTVYSITMLDNSHKAISYPVLGGLEDLWFFDEGSAR